MWWVKFSVTVQGVPSTVQPCLCDHLSDPISALVHTRSVRFVCWLTLPLSATGAAGCSCLRLLCAVVVCWVLSGLRGVSAGPNHLCHDADLDASPSQERDLAVQRA